MRSILKTTLVLLVLGLVLVACGEEVDEAGNLGDRTINVVATTGQITDAVRNVGGERVDVTGLMGPGVDPHLFQPTASDVGAMEDADVIFYNGLELEGRMGDVFVSMARTRPTVQVTSEIPEDQLLPSAVYEGAFDPHIWFNVELWIMVVNNIEAELSELDPEHAETYESNADAYIAELEELHAYALEQFETIPEQSRLLITAHDAFGYLGDRYGLEVIGLQGLSTATEAGAADVQDLAALIVERDIQAIFVETSVPPATIEAVQAAVNAQDHEVAIGGSVFSDAMGAEGTPEGTYVGMFRHNVDTIVQSLS